jgi:hypothetical protein
MIETRVDSLDFLAQLGDEVIFDYTASADTVTTIVTALLALQEHSNPITVGTIEPTNTLTFTVQQASILDILTNMQEEVGGYISVNNDRKLDWLNDIGEDKGQQIRYKKNIKGLTRTRDYSNFGNRLYCYGAGEGAARVVLSDATSAKKIGSSTTGTTNLNLNMFQLNKFTTSTVVINKIKVYCLVNGNVKVAVYEDDDGEPGALVVANNTGQAVTSGQWNTLEIDSMCLEAGDYWLAAIADTTGAISRNAGASTRRCQTVTYATFSFPDPAGTGFTPVTTEMSIAGWFIAGEDYVEDTPSQDDYGMCIRQLVNKSVTDADDLLVWAAAKLAEVRIPRTSYRIDMINLAAQGWDFEYLQLGSIVNVIDEDLGINVSARIVHVIRDLSDPQNIEIEISNVTRDIVDSTSGVQSSVLFQERISPSMGGEQIVTGILSSENWGAAAGSQFSLNDGTFKLGGSASPKLSWDGATLTVQGAIYATSGEFTGTLKTSNIESGKILTVNGAISAMSGDIVLDATGFHIDTTSFSDNLDIFTGAKHTYFYQSATQFTIDAAIGGDVIIFAQYTGGVPSGKIKLYATMVTLPNRASDPASPTAGDEYFNTTTNTKKIYNGTAWKTVTWS